MCCPSTGKWTPPARVWVRGPSNSGKTTLIERLIPRLRAKGMRVGTVKHAHHGFDMDQPGKDSWRHAHAGSEAIAVISPERTAWILQTPEGLSIDAAIEPMARRVDLVLVEGFKREADGSTIRLEPDPRARLRIDAGVCWVGVHPNHLRLEEVEQIAVFCASARKAERPPRSASHSYPDGSRFRGSP